MSDEARARDPMDDFWFRPLGRRTSTGVAVTLETALKVPVVYACLKALSQTIASLPCAVFERTGGGDRRRVEGHPLMRVLDDPDGESSRHEWLEQMVWDLASAGNFFARVEAAEFGPIGRLRRMAPAKVTVERLADGSRRWTLAAGSRGWALPQGERRQFVEGEVWHVRAAPLIDDLVGTSQIAVGAEAIGGMLSLQEYGASFIENDATPPLLIKHPGNFKDEQSKTNFLTAIKAWFGRKRRSPAVLEYGMDVVKLGNTPEEAQFLETRKELQAEIARLWRMPPHKVGMLDKATFSNIEHQALEFVTDTLAPWLDLIEGAVNRHLILNPQRFYFEFNVAGLLRGDIKARFEAYAQARQWGWLSVNEIRRLENLNPIGARGDQYLQPMNMTPAGQAGAPRAALLDARGMMMGV